MNIPQFNWEGTISHNPLAVFLNTTTDALSLRVAHTEILRTLKEFVSDEFGEIIASEYTMVELAMDVQPEMIEHLDAAYAAENYEFDGSKGFLGICMRGEMFGTPNEDSPSALIRAMANHIYYDMDVLTDVIVRYRVSIENIRPMVLSIIGHERRHALQTNEEFTLQTNLLQDTVTGACADPHLVDYEIDANVHGWQFMLENF